MPHAHANAPHRDAAPACAPSRSRAVGRYGAIVSRLLLSYLALLLAAGCARSVSSGPQPQAVVQIYAASSLTEAFQELERGFEATHPAIDVQLTFAGSQTLRLQLEHGARADLLATANEAHMQALRAAGLVAAPRTFAYNTLALIAPREGAPNIASFADLPRAQRVVIGAPNVPLGAYTRALLKRAGARLGRGFAAAVRGHVVSEERNARLVRAKVALGEADAAVVYRTDAVAGPRVRVVAIPSELNVRARYPIALVREAQHQVEARQFLSYLASPAGRATLRRHGFMSEAP